MSGKLDQKAAAYILLNLTGSAILAVLAALDRQYGFLLLEGAWAIISAWSLVSTRRNSSHIRNKRRIY